MTEFYFTKMQGTGNDFVIFDNTQQKFNPSKDNICYIADRHYGVGCDQVLLLEPAQTEQADIYYRIFNNDGSEVSQCGNGARCIALYLSKKLNKSKIIANTNHGKLTINIMADEQAQVNMGVPNFELSAIGLQVEKKEVVYTINKADQHYSFSALSMGNPHAVFVVDDVHDSNIPSIALNMQSMSIFSEDVNISFIQIMDNQHARLRVYERGAGETLACGSGACAAMVAGHQLGLLEKKAIISMSGGDLDISWEGEGEPVFMIGTAKMIFEGKIEL